MTPTCPVHLAPMRESSKGGGYFCPKKKEDGSYCTEKIAGPKPATSSAPSSPAGNDYRYAASLAAAAQMFRGAGVEMVDDMLALTDRLYKSFPR